jgi:hypothetical protein
MTYRFRALETFESELRRVVEEPSKRARRRRGWPPTPRRAGWGLAVPVAGVLLAGGTLALAATGVILTGSSVPAAAPVAPSEGIGDPVSSRLLPLQVRDPGGGLPWGMRIVETSRGLVCAQVGRIDNGQLGELGIDGAFNDDGLFHPFPPGVVQSFPGGSTEDGTEIEGGTCILAGNTVGSSRTAWGSAVAAERWGVDQNATSSRGHLSATTSQRRDISYGLLGPHAVRVSYREGSSVHTETVVPGFGAYLIVQPAAAGSDHEGSGEAPGTQTPGEGPGTVGAVTTITYAKNGTICENGYDARNGATVPIANACPPAGAPAPPVHGTQAGLPRLHPMIHLEVRAGRVTAAEISFAAPFPVRSAAQDYYLWSKGCGTRDEGAAAAVFNHDVLKGGIVRLVLKYPFAARCSGAARPVEILFDSSAADARRSPGRPPGQLVLANATIRLPRGDKGADAPH